ncbi:unnamed protein product [Caenorhabditis nigoni]
MVARETEAVWSISFLEFAEKRRRYSEPFDFVATCGPIEIVGLGRYGDVLDAFGDLQMMAICLKGVKVKVKFESKTNQRIEATINCGTLIINFVECHNIGHFTEFTVFSSLKRINSSCFSQCGTKKIRFQFDGTLEEEGKFQLEQSERKSQTQYLVQLQICGMGCPNRSELLQSLL